MGEFENFLVVLGILPFYRPVKKSNNYSENILNKLEILNGQLVAIKDFHNGEHNGILEYKKEFDTYNLIVDEKKISLKIHDIEKLILMN